jgi:hypothetical protein
VEDALSNSCYCQLTLTSKLSVSLDWLTEINLPDELLDPEGSAPHAHDIIMPSIVDLCIGRRDHDQHRQVYLRFVPCITGKSAFANRLLVATKESDLCTRSDEALTLLLLENSYDRWIDVYKKAAGEVSKRRMNKNRQWHSDVRTRYTDGGIMYRSNHDTTKCSNSKGWTNEGIECFNELCSKVSCDRCWLSILYHSVSNKFLTSIWVGGRR